VVQTFFFVLHITHVQMAYALSYHLPTEQHVVLPRAVPTERGTTTVLAVFQMGMTTALEVITQCHRCTLTIVCKTILIWDTTTSRAVQAAAWLLHMQEFQLTH